MRFNRYIGLQTSFLLIIGFSLLAVYVFKLSLSLSETQLTFLSIGLAAMIYIASDIDSKSKEFNVQINTLHSLLTKINLIERKVKGFKKEINGKGYSPYKVDNIDSDYYLKNLWFKIDGIKTRELIDKLSTIDDKISIINNVNDMIDSLIPNIREREKEMFEEFSSLIKENEKIKDMIEIQFWKEYLTKKTDFVKYINEVIDGELMGYLSDVKDFLAKWKIY